MNKLQIFNSPEFGQVRMIVEDDKILFCASDVASALKYSNISKAINDHCPHVTKRYIGVETGTKADGTPAIQNVQMNFIPEGDIYRLVVRSKLPTAIKFEGWVFDDIIPSIRKHGGYLTPAKIEEVLSNPDTIIKLATELKKLRTENQMQAQQIAEFKPIKEYVDIILQSTDTVTITQIAADYGLSAKKLNKILNEEKIQHRVNDQWILYSNMMNKGYTKSETIDIERSDGRIETKMYTRWTQKGRLKIHEILTGLGFIANYDREQQRLFA